jgi:hypothetical protein
MDFAMSAAADIRRARRVHMRTIKRAEIGREKSAIAAMVTS